jgi:hypothetical protein
VQGLLIRVSTAFGSKCTTTLVRHADRLTRRAAEIIPRANNDERDWLAHSAACIQGLIGFIAKQKTVGAYHALDRLVHLGWGHVLAQLHARIIGALRSNFPEFEGDLSAAARRLLELASQKP